MNEMTDKTMTLEQVRDWLLACANGESLIPMRGEMRQWADAITCHLSQPAERGEAQEKAEPVVRIQRGTDRSLYALILPGAEVREGQLCYTAPPAERVRVPDGWKLVPIRPTPLMVGEGAWAYRQVDGDIAQCYEAMVKSAPEADHD